METPAVCTNCKCKMHLIRNWNTAYTGDVQNTYFETFTLFACRVKGAFTKGTGFKKIKPQLFVCENCGKLEMYLNNSDLSTVMSIENDSDYVSSRRNNDITESHTDTTVNLTNMSRLRQRAQERRVRNSYE